MNKLLFWFGVAVATAMNIFAGPTVHYANGDIINYGDYTAPRDREIIVAVDGARYEPRWHAMLDDKDLRDLIFLEAGRQGDNGNVFIFGR